jgi:translation initiation factor 2-alpha kinase 4
MSARVIGRGGSATTHLKRYEIDKVYHKSISGGHPRESLEASFDIVFEDNERIHLLEAETIHVASQVIGMLPAKQISPAPFVMKPPLFYIRLSNTRLTDAVMDLCGIPAKDSLRRACCHILTRFTAPAPSMLHAVAVTKGHSKQTDKHRKVHLEKLDTLLKDAVEHHGLSNYAAKRLRSLIEFCSPLPCDVFDAIDSLQSAIAKIRSLDGPTLEPRRLKRFEDAAKSLKNIRDLLIVLNNLNLVPKQRPVPDDQGPRSCCPICISLDLGLRQRRKHYHGGTIFQCIVLPHNFFEKIDPDEHNDALIAPTGRGFKVAEGGNYSDLVRRYRPPGNFASTVVDHYTTARIPVCTGVRFAVGKIVELVYLDASLFGSGSMFKGSVSSSAEKLVADKQGMETLRQSLGHPLQYTDLVRVLVASVHGMDAASTPDRFLVASRLWSEGISAEYLPHSGIVLSLLKRITGQSDEEGGASDWLLSELQGACSLLRIPFIVIVQPHLLKDKNTVRLRQVSFDSLPQGPTGSASSGGGIIESLVSLDNLAGAILDAMTTRGPEDSAEDSTNEMPGLNVYTRESSRTSKSTSPVECIFVDQDQYYTSSKEIPKNDTPYYKSYLKSMKSAKLNAEYFLGSLQDPSSVDSGLTDGVPVFAVPDVSFYVLRDFGTSLMRRERKEQSASGACAEMIEKYPKHKRILKTLSLAIDNYMRQRHDFWSGGSSSNSNVGGNGSTSSSNHTNDHHPSSSLITILFYSKLDDRFDMVTLKCNKTKSMRVGSFAGAPSKRR